MPQRGSVTGFWPVTIPAGLDRQRFGTSPDFVKFDGITLLTTCTKNCAAVRTGSANFTGRYWIYIGDTAIEMSSRDSSEIGFGYRVKQHFRGSLALIPLTIALVFHNAAQERQKRHLKLMAKPPPKKGPRMTVASHAARSNQDIERDQFEAELDASADSVLGAIEVARSKMTDSERERSDKNADAILNSATDAAKRSRRRA